jgi:hypothetical protein
LTDLEFRVWWTYELAADDFGVMRRSAIVLQSANVALARRSKRAIDQALDSLVTCGLLLAFAHQGEAFVCQASWQDFQKIEYPRLTFTSGNWRPDTVSRQPTPLVASSRIALSASLTAAVAACDVLARQGDAREATLLDELLRVKQLALGVTHRADDGADRDAAA